MSRVLRSTLMIINLVILAACGTVTPEPTSTAMATRAPSLTLASQTSKVTQMPTTALSLTPVRPAPGIQQTGTVPLSPTTSPLPPTEPPSLTVTVASQPSPTFKPPSVPSTPQLEEWLAFAVRDFRQWEPTIYNLAHAHAAIYLVKNDGNKILQPELVDPNEITIERSLAWSHDGRYLLFDGSSTPELIVVPQLYLADLPAGTTLNITSGQVYGSAYGRPSWEPEGQRFTNTIDARVTTTGGKTQYLPNLVITRASDRRRWRLTTSPSSDLYPSWSPNGEWIAFLRYTSSGSPCGPIIPTNYEGCNKADLYLIRSNGNDPKLLLESVYIHSDRDQRDSAYNAPDWSPDSQWLAMLVGKQQLDIALVNIENGETRVLAAREAQDIYPTWSPDGSRLAFVSNRGGDEDIYIVSTDGMELINLTRNPGSDFNPVWSPSGCFIAFLSDREEPGAYKLYVMNADGSDQRKLYDGYVFTRPAWFPRLDMNLRDFIGNK